MENERNRKIVSEQCFMDGVRKVSCFWKKEEKKRKKLEPMNQKFSIDSKPQLQCTNRSEEFVFVV